MTLAEVVEAFRQRGVQVVQQGRSFRCRCPAHAAGDAHLQLSERPGGGVKAQCWSHDCELATIAASVGLKVTDFIPQAGQTNGAGTGKGLGQVTQRYRYTDEKGELLFEVWRYEPKTFRPHHLGPAGRWEMFLPKGTRLPLYRLPELLAADPKAPVFLCAGEKDVDNLRRLGLVATTNQGGEAIRWAGREEWLATLQGRYCVVLQDHDPPDQHGVRPGEKHAKEVFAALTEAGIRARRLLLPDLAEGEDVSDWLGRGGTAEALLALAKPEVRFRLLTIAEMLALPAPSWQVADLWEVGGIVMVFGEGTSGKTFFVVDVAMHLVCGLPWHGRELEGGPVIYVNADGGIPFRQRLQAWQHAFPDCWPQHPFLIYNDRIDMRDRGLFQAFVDEQQQQAQQPALIVLDTFHRVMPGADENDARDTSQFFDALQAARRDLGATGLFIHHANRADTGHRGHSSLRDDSDTAIEIRRHESGLRQVRCDKQRNGPEFPEFFFDLNPVLDSCVVEMAEPPPSDEEAAPARRRGSRAGDEERAAEILRLIVAAGELSQAELAEELGLSGSRVSVLCTMLKQRGQIVSRQGMAEGRGRRPVLYSPRKKD